MAQKALNMEMRKKYTAASIKIAAAWAKKQKVFPQTEPLKHFRRKLFNWLRFDFSTWRFSHSVPSLSFHSAGF